MTLVLVFMLGHDRDALRRLRVQRLGRPQVRRAREAHGRPAACRAARSRRGRRWRWRPGSRSLGFALVVLATNRTTILLSFAALAIAIAYPFFKRFFALPQAFLGIAFSFGIPMAFAAVQDNVPPLGWWLFAINLVWVIAYDTEYAMVDRDDDIRLGLRTSALTFGRFDVRRGRRVLRGLSGGHGVDRLVAGIRLQLLGGTRGRVGARRLSSVAHPHARRDACFRAFLGNHWLGLAVFAGVVLDHAVRLRAWPNAL